MNNRSDAPNDPFRAFIDAGTGEPLRKSMLQQMERFWEGQRKLLDEYETVSQALLERRRSATVATLDALHKMSTTMDGAEWAKCCSDWFAGSLTRAAEDGRDMIQGGFKVMSEVSQNMTAGMAETAQATAETHQAAARGTASMQTAAAEQGAASVQEAARIAAARAAQRPKRPEESARA
jgi:hypothetical protein